MPNLSNQRLDGMSPGWQGSRDRAVVLPLWINQLTGSELTLAELLSTISATHCKHDSLSNNAKQSFYYIKTVILIAYAACAV